MANVGVEGIKEDCDYVKELIKIPSFIVHLLFASSKHLTEIHMPPASFVFYLV